MGPVEIAKHPPKSDQETQSSAKPGWRTAWEWVCGVLALIGVVDVTSQLIKWAALIHWIVEKYAAVRVWLFGWLPFHVPPELRDYILLFLIFMSVTNVGFYQRTGRMYVKQLFLMLTSWENPDRTFDGTPLSANKESTREERVLAVLTVGLAVPAGAAAVFYIVQFVWHITKIQRIEWGTDEGVGVLVILFLLALLGGALVAWRWIASTAAAFVVLVAVNELYVRWLEPFAHH